MRICPVITAALSVILLSNLAPVSSARDAAPDVTFKIYNPQPQADEPPKASSDNASQSHLNIDSNISANPSAISVHDKPADIPVSNLDTAASDDSKESANAQSDTKIESNETQGEGEKIATRVLRGYVRVVPSGTKIPIIMDTAVDSDTSQEGDEFSARTGEDLTIDGSMAVPAGSTIKGRIAQLSAPRHLNRSGSVALKFDTVTTPDSRQIPIVANIVARGGVVHARRGLKDIAIDTGIVTLPAAAGLGIGLIAANAGSSSLGAGSGALIGAGIGTALGVALLLSKKGKKVDLRPGDELKIELAEDLRMPM